MIKISEELLESQRSEDWYKNRIGKFTGSGIDKLMSKGRSSEWGDTSKSYVFSKLYERVSQSVIAIPETYQMSKGKEIEDDAMRTFEERTRFTLEKAEFIVYTPLPFIGASPDGLVYDSKGDRVGVFETKCRLDEQMLKNAFVRVDEKHKSFWQLQTEMLVAEVGDAYFTHYSDEREQPFDLQIQIVKRNMNALDRMVERATKADDVIIEAIKSVGSITDKRISYITLTDRLIKMREYVYKNLE